MKARNRLIQFLCIAATALTFLNGCNKGGSKEDESEYVDIGGHPAEVTLTRDPNLKPPAGFEDSLVYKDENYEQKQKFVFDAAPGEDVRIVNPSPEIITKEDIEHDISVKDAFYTDDINPSPSVFHRSSSPYKKFTLLDANTKRNINKLEPNGKAIIRLNEPTQGGDLTIYEKEEGSPLNFEAKDPSVNELIVATSRPEVEEFDPNDDEIRGLLYSKCVDKMDLTSKIEGQFIYSEQLGLNQGDQFFIGNSVEFDSSSTFYTFLKEESVAKGYLVSYTVPDYSKCYSKLDIHHDEQEVDLDSYDDPVKMPSAEELVRSIDQDGKLNSILDEEVLKEIQTNNELCKKMFGKGWQPSLTFNIRIKTYVVTVAINFNTSGPAFCMNFAITFNALVSQKSYGSWLLSGGVNIFFRKTISTYTDFSIKLFPYPRINYVLATKTISEVSVNFFIGITFSMKTEKADEDKVDKGSQIQQLQNDIVEDMGNAAPIGGDPGGGGEPVPVPEPVPVLDPNQNVADVGGDNPEPASLDNINVVPRGVKRDVGDDNTHYGGDKLGDKRYAGVGLVISGPGLVIPIGPVQLEIGIALVINPDIQGRIFVTYNHVSCDVVCKVVKGFDEPEGFGDNVEYSRSRWVIGAYVKLGFEVGIMLELQVYIAGAKAVFYASIQALFGIYFNLQGVGIMTFGSSLDFVAMLYASFEVGFFFRVSLVLNILDDTIIVSFKAFEKRWPPFFAFGTNLHFLQFNTDRDEFDWYGGHYINIDDMGVLNLTWFSTSSFTVGDGQYSWFYEEVFYSAFGRGYKRLFDDLDILEGGEYITFDFKHGWFEVKDNAPEMFTFKFKVSIDKWLGCTCDDESFTVHYFSNKLRAIKFEGFPNPYENNGVHVGGGLIKQGEIYEAPNMPAKEDGTPFYGWLATNGLFMKAGEQMEVGSMSLTFNPVYRPQVTYVVQFYDGYNNLICKQNVAPGGSAVAPNPETRDAKMGDAKFVCWDREFDNVYSNFNVYGIYTTGGKQ